MTRRQPVASAPEATTAKAAKAVRKRTTEPTEATGANSANRANSANDATAPPAGEADPTRLDRIREAAYQRYVARGHRDGHDLEDWLAAEAALSGEPVAD